MGSAVTASQIARRAAMRRLESGSDVAAIAESAQPMMSDIEVASGMTQRANVLKPNLFIESTDPNVNYLDALRTGLPEYVNTYRAYQKELDDAKKKNSSGETTIPGFNFDYDALAKLLQPWNYGYNQASMIDFSVPVPTPGGTEYYPSPYGPTPDVRTSPTYKKALMNLTQRKYSAPKGTIKKVVE